MNVAASPLLLAYAFGFGVALALVDRALKVGWLALLFGAGAADITNYGAYQAHVQSSAQGLLTSPTIVALLAGGYGLVEALFLSARGVMR